MTRGSVATRVARCRRRPTWLLLAVVVVAGCASRLQRVRPWEREQLSRRDMRPELQQADGSFRTHVHAVREGSEGGSGSAGGGCGCN